MFREGEEGELGGFASLGIGVRFRVGEQARASLRIGEEGFRAREGWEVGRWASLRLYGGEEPGNSSARLKSCRSWWDSVSVERELERGRFLGDWATCWDAW